MFASQMKKKNWFADTASYLIFDDTVINKRYGYKIELTRRQYSGNEHKVICILSAAKFVGQEQLIVYILSLYRA